jgi:hypothetical protein
MADRLRLMVRFFWVFVLAHVINDSAREIEDRESRKKTS